MHAELYHSANDKFFNLIKRDKPEDVTAETMAILEDKLCFIASIPGVITFSRMVIIYLIWILGDPVLHVVEADTHYSAPASWMASRRRMYGTLSSTAGSRLIGLSRQIKSAFWVRVHIQTVE